MKGRLRLREVMVIIMIKEIIHDPLFLSLASRPATPDDMNIAIDLIETLHFHQHSCVGMAANMIGERVRIIAFAGDEKLSRRYFVMFNPEIIKKEGAYDAEESWPCADRRAAPMQAVQDNQGEVSGRKLRGQI